MREFARDINSVLTINERFKLSIVAQPK